MDIVGTRIAAQMLGVAEGTLRYWRHTNVGPPSFKIRGKVAYRRDELEAWLASQEATDRRGDVVAM